MRQKCARFMCLMSVLILLAFGVESPRAQEAPSIMVQAGTHFSMALLEDGSVWSWGGNLLGELGVGDSNNRVIPTQIERLDSPKQIVAAVRQLGAPTAALYENGTVYAWGGILLQPPPPNPARIFTRPLELPQIENIERIAISATMIFGLTSEGRVWRWDWEGDETAPATRLSISDVIYISGPLALTSTGAVHDITRNPPPKIFESEGIVKVAGSDQNPHFLALYLDGRVRAWGSNSSGQLGIGPVPLSVTEPRLIPDLFNIVDVVAAHEYSVALDSDGNVWTWGSNTYGQLGDGSKVSRTSPILVEGVSDIISISAGWEHTLAMNSSGEVFAWGNNKYGQLASGGDGADCVGSPQCFELLPEPVVGLPELMLID